MSVRPLPIGDSNGRSGRGAAPVSATPRMSQLDSRVQSVAAAGSAALQIVPPAAAQPAAEIQPDHFIVDEFGNRYAGRHLIIDLYNVAAGYLSDLELIRETLTEAAQKAGATLLNIDLHHFQPNGGVSGVAVLAESHISIHTWPEHGYAAIDAFMCGEARPERAIAVLRAAFSPGGVQVNELRRGMMVMEG
jgi:S-adenosylmethionine decarboxylase